MKSYFIAQGSKFQVTDSKAVTIFDDLPPNTYSVQATPEGNLYLLQVDDMSVPDKVYGDVVKRASRVFNTFQKRPGSTGLLLSGEKGSGKTMLAKILSAVGRNNKMPTILVQDNFSGPGFNAFMQNITTPCIVIFDEFEKTYKPEEQAEILTLFDGVFSSKKLFVVTCNSVGRIDENMINRPGRLYYHLSYSGVDEAFIREYCAEKLKAKDKVEDVLKVSVLIDPFNFDLLQAIVEEMNSYNESAFDAIKYVNAKPQGKMLLMKASAYDEAGLKYDITEPHCNIDNPFNIDLRFEILEAKGDNQRQRAGRTGSHWTNYLGRTTKDRKVLIDIYINGTCMTGVNYKTKGYIYSVKVEEGKLKGKTFHIHLDPASYDYRGRYDDL